MSDNCMDVDNENDIIDSEDEYETSDNGDKLECDLSAYVLFHEGSAGHSCLSFDIVQDEFGAERICNGDVSCCFIGGTRADKPHLNSIILLKMNHLKNVDNDDSSDDSDSDSEDEEKTNNVKSVSSKHAGCVNRIRATKINEAAFAATWSELGVVNIWNIDQMYNLLSDELECEAVSSCDMESSYSFSKHRTEGYAIDWSGLQKGTLASGCCNGDIYIHNLSEGGAWSSCGSYSGHTLSVEDIQWSPNEENVFATCSVDKSIKIWDSRSHPSSAGKMTCEEAHSTDINVIHWSKSQPFVASGGDDGKVKIWDLRMFKNKHTLAELCYHDKPITTVEWHPTDSSVLATGGEDDQVLQWDLAVETTDDSSEENVPQQLLFVHKGQQELKELHWHQQIPGLLITTANSGFNVFKTISC